MLSTINQPFKTYYIYISHNSISLFIILIIDLIKIQKWSGVFIPIFRSHVSLIVQVICKIINRLIKFKFFILYFFDVNISFMKVLQLIKIKFSNKLQHIKKTIICILNHFANWLNSALLWSEKNVRIYYQLLNSEACPFACYEFKTASVQKTYSSTIFIPQT